MTALVGTFLKTQNSMLTLREDSRRRSRITTVIRDACRVSGHDVPVVPVDVVASKERGTDAM